MATITIKVVNFDPDQDNAQCQNPDCQTHTQYILEHNEKLYCLPCGRVQILLDADKRSKDEVVPEVQPKNPAPKRKFPKKRRI